MTEKSQLLSLAAQKFILHWGEMGTRWGINRTVAQVHALLFLSPRPMAAEEIARTLSVFGDRRQHFESMKDLWEMFRVIVEERKRREFDPTVGVVRECVAEAKKSSASDAYARERMEELLEFIVLMSALFDEFRNLSPTTMKGVVKLRGGIRKLLHG
jgi:DNA-binding transcriptional regulator GbsR (MarR family)